MTLKELDNLVKINDLKAEPPDQAEFNNMINSAKRSLKDAGIDGLSDEGKFVSAYTAAHILSLAALRGHGYRSSNRYQVFQCLVHTVAFDQAKCRMLGKCHNLRNVAEYEGHLEITPQLLKELIGITVELLKLVEALEPISSD
jgi:hypothetical protein